MTLPSLCRALVAAALLLLVAPAWGGEGEFVDKLVASSSTPEASGIAESRSLIQEGKYDEALAILRPLARGREVDGSVLFQIGLAATDASQQPGLADDQRKALLDEAIGAFRTMLIDRPGLVRVRLELARAFFLKGENDLSRRQFEHVLAGNPPAPVLANVRRFLAEIRARRRWTLHAGFAPGAGHQHRGHLGREDHPHRHRWPTVAVPARRGGPDDIGDRCLGMDGAGSTQYPLGDGVRLRAGANLSRRDYAGSRFDQTFVSGHAGPRWLVGRNTEASVLASVQRRWSAGAPDYDALGARAEAGHRFTRRVTANAQVSWHDRRYRTRTFLDGPVMGLPLGGTWVVAPMVRADAGLGWGRERPEAERWRHERRWLRAGVTVALPRDFTVGGSGELRWTDYAGNWFPHTTGGESREDRTYSARLSLHNRALSWRGFSPQVSLVHEVRRTNAQLYDYQRTGGELRFVRLF